MTCTEPNSDAITCFQVYIEQTLMHHMLSHTASLYKFDRVENIQNLLFHNGGIKLAVTTKKKTRKYPQILEVKQTHLHNLQDKEIVMEASEI